MNKTNRRGKQPLDVEGQYGHDNLGSEHPPLDPTGTLDYRGNGDIGFHQGSSLHDEGRGEIDDATGEIVKDDSPEAQHFAGEDMRVVPDSVVLSGLGRAIGNRPEPHDPKTDPDNWMRENGHEW
jgi:hypothetical protein